MFRPSVDEISCLDSGQVDEISSIVDGRRRRFTDSTVGESHNLVQELAPWYFGKGLPTALQRLFLCFPRELRS